MKNGKIRKPGTKGRVPYKRHAIMAARASGMGNVFRAYARRRAFIECGFGSRKFTHVLMLSAAMGVPGAGEETRNRNEDGACARGCEGDVKIASGAGRVFNDDLAADAAGRSLAG